IVHRAIGADGKETAIKIFLTNKAETARESFAREVNASGHLEHHPHILDYTYFGYWRGFFYVVTPYCPLGTLAALLKRMRFTRAEQLSLLCQIAAAIVFAHEHGVYHGDIKPSNILVVSLNPIRVVVSDWSLAAIAGFAELVGPNGTPRFSPLEQLAGLVAANEACDAYAFGRTAVEVTRRKANDGSLREIPQFRQLIENLSNEIPRWRPAMLSAWETLERISSEI